MTNRDRLRNELTRLLDDSPCAYETLIEELKRQLKFWQKAKSDEISAAKHQ